MNEYIEKARNFLQQENIDYLLVNSTNEFLVEYNQLEKNSRYYLTNFSGSTGDALVSNDKIWLFVDGRYHIQADLEVDHKEITVVKLCSPENTIEAISELVEENSSIGICAKKISQEKLEELKFEFEEKDKNITIKLFDIDVIEHNNEFKPQNLTVIKEELTGMSVEEKIEEIIDNYNFSYQTKLQDNEAILVTNIEELSWVYNTRNFEKENSCSMEGKAIITNKNNFLFKDETLKDFEKFVNEHKEIDTYLIDKSSISANDFKFLGEKAVTLEESPIRFLKCIKTDEELEHYKDAFHKTDLALLDTRKYIEENDNLSEFAIKEELEKNFKKYGAVGQSFTSIVAKDGNSALAHYSKSSKDEVLKNGSTVLIDCGGYFEGGLATDITRVFIKGKPNDLQKQVYTTVLKAFLRAYNLKEFECGYDIDKVAREFLQKSAPSGFVFNHGLGHGVGVSVHEAPPRLSLKSKDSQEEIVDNMCFTIEPGLYKENYFGVRLENSCYYQDGKIHSFSNMCYEEKLIDFDMLTEEEKEWLKEFEVK